MTKGTWARSGARPSTGRGVRPAGSWAASVARARATWDGLPGHVRDAGMYSDVAAAAILACAATLWADTAASMGDDGSGDDASGV